jgi:D-alanyl-D-alanine carboxypeptidase
VRSVIVVAMISSANNRVLRFFRRAGVTAVAVTLLAGAAAPGVATADSRAAVGQERPELQAAAQAWVDAGFAGMQLRVHDERGEWVGSAGVRKLGGTAKPPTNGRFWAGSIAKTSTATVVLQLVAEGKVGLDTSVHSYLPEYGLDPRITVRMLLQHTSGLANYTGQNYPNGTYVPGIPVQGQEWVDNRFHTYRPDELVRKALSMPPAFEPGTGQDYANTNFTLALLLIEKVAPNHSYKVEMERRILRPLKMHGTVVAGARTQLPGPHAHGYYRYEDAGQVKVVDVSRQNLSLLAGAGDALSTTQDLHTFISALMSGKLVPAPLLAEMRTPHGWLSYGFGLMVQDSGCGVTLFSHNGSPPAGYGALMYSTADGSKTLTASITMGDAAIDPATVYRDNLPKLLETVFCDGQTAG